MAEGHREAAPRVLDGREHDGSLAAEGRRHITRHIAVYPRNLTAANTSQCWSSSTMLGWYLTMSIRRECRQGCSSSGRQEMEIVTICGVPA